MTPMTRSMTRRLSVFSDEATRNASDTDDVLFHTETSRQTGERKTTRTILEPSRNNSARIPVTPLSHMPAESQVRIRRAQAALDSDYRTSYTYADTRTYTHLTSTRDYESPVLARRGIHSPNKCRSGVTMHLLHYGDCNPLLALLRQFASPARTLGAATICALLLTLFIFLPTVRYVVSSEEMQTLKAPMFDVSSWWWGKALSLIPERRITVEDTATTEGNASSDELDNLRVQVANLREEMETLRAQRWATVEHAHAEYVDGEQLRSLLTNERARIEALAWQLAEMKTELDRKQQNATAPSIQDIGTNLEEIRRLVTLALRKYDADKTGLVDYALESAGGRVVSTRCTSTYTTCESGILGIPLRLCANSPRTVIQRNSQSVQPGECWAFKGSTGYLLIKLNGYINVTHISYEHIPLSLASDGNLDAAPRHMQIWGYQSEHDPEATMIAEFEYNALSDEALQTFKVNREVMNVAYPMIELRVLSNHGHPRYTCLYRLRVHGTRC